MEMTIITIDSREVLLCNHFRTFDGAVIRALDVGDILLESGGDSIVIERKTLNDLASSIRDGRHREQKARLTATYPANRIIFLIEGSFSPDVRKTIGTVPESTLVSSIINTMLRDGLHIYQTQSLLETIHVIESMARKLEKGDLVTKKSELSEAANYCQVLKAKKKQNITPAVCYVQQLSFVPGVSIQMADSIACHYPTMTKLIEALTQGDTKEMVRTLSNVTFGAHKRRIGPKVAERLIQYLTYEE